jgi:3-dehydroquinate dehydratase II
MKILVMNGPNLKLLGIREPDVYGNETLDGIIDKLLAWAASKDVRIDVFHSDVEGELVARVGGAGRCYDGIVINPAAYTHTSVALRDAIKACGIPVVEVHLSNTHRRESFRHGSLTAGVCLGQVMGFGGHGYVMALEGLVQAITSKKGT